jgi:uncharacterized protein (DUF362 family)/Pyruvate/2-oxoacid:ferredoxin oxidoreductase delta subunit
MRVQEKVLILPAEVADFPGEVERILEEFPLPWEGKRVLVKPNILGPFPPERGVTTHPQLVRAVVRQLLRRGAEVMVGDNPGVGGYGTNERAAKVSGIVSASLGCFVNLAQGVVREKIKSRFVNEVGFSRMVLEADLIISLPRFKTHSLTQLTGGIKNTYGYIAGGDKSRLHTLALGTRQFSELVVDIFAHRPPHLTIVDGLTAMEGEGPSSSELRPLNRLIASYNAVAVDSAMARIMGLKEADVFQIQFAKEKGLYRGAQIEGDASPLPNFKGPFGSGLRQLIAPLVNSLAFRYTHPKPRINLELCVHCNRCVNACPVQAIDETPNIDQSKCITCYCCQEVCIYSAVVISGVVYNFIHRKR